MSGAGRIYKRGNIWWVAFYRHGHQFRESANTTVEAEARRILRSRLTTSAMPREERVTFDALVQLVRDDYAAKEYRTAYDLEHSRIAHLKRFFGADRAVDITAGRVRSFVARRREQGAASATINRELGVLKRGFKLAIQDRMLSQMPFIGMLPETNIRQGFVTKEQFEAIAAKLSEYAVDPARFLYVTGWRVNEALTLEWRDLDFEGGTITLRGERSKTGYSRVMPMAAEIKRLIDRARENRRLECVRVFHRGGIELNRWSFARTWRRAAKAAGLAGIIVHDLRRSAARNMVRAGVPERVAMAMTGHRTRSMFDRYNIVSTTDLISAQERIRDYLDGNPERSASVRVLALNAKK